MKFGIFYEHSVQKPWTRQSELRAYQQALEQIELADELGFDQVWEVEHHFLEEYSHSSAPEVFLAAAAARTKRIRIGQGIAVCLPPMNHPVRIAERAAALDLISNGRLEFGTGRSATWAEVGGFGIDPDCTKEMWDEVIRAIPKMWTEEEFEWNGKYFKMPPRNVLPKPIQDPHPPMWVAVSSPETAVQAAERGIGMLGVTLGTPADYKRLVSDYRRIIKHCDPVGKFVNNQVNAASWMYCGENEEEARNVGGMAAFNFFNTAAHLVGLGGISPSHAYTAQANATALLNQAEIFSLREGFPVGSAEQIIQNLRYWEEVGVERVVSMINFDQVIPQKKVLASLERFAKYVMPAFADDKKTGKRDAAPKGEPESPPMVT
ncbi:MAG TPA: LLM class flavin-dependent oxidoreductase [Candidatus Acidoferrales bacterium]|nr:LLM class flavin-dependent oxidoreductase [Candidatus Acidoferrales bacterium]